MSNEPNDQESTRSTRNILAVAIGVGVAIGAGVGVALDNYPVGIAIGIAIGVAIYFGQTRAGK